MSQASPCNLMLGTNILLKHPRRVRANGLMSILLVERLQSTSSQWFTKMERSWRILLKHVSIYNCSSSAASLTLSKCASLQHPFSSAGTLGKQEKDRLLVVLNGRNCSDEAQKSPRIAKLLGVPFPFFLGILLCKFPH